MVHESDRGYLVFSTPTDTLDSFHEDIVAALDRAKEISMPDPTDGNVSHPAYVVDAYQVTATQE